MSSLRPTRSLPVWPSRRLPKLPLKVLEFDQVPLDHVEQKLARRGQAHARGHALEHVARRWTPRRSGWTGSAPRVRPPAIPPPAGSSPAADQADRLVDLQVFHALSGGWCNSCTTRRRINGRQHHVNRHYFAARANCTMTAKGILMKKLLLASAAAALSATAANAEIRVGVLHSTTGTMAISETTLRDVMLMLIEQQNEAGGLLGEELVPVVVDGASDWPLYAERTRELLTVEEVDVIFCCWTSSSRKAILPVVEELGGIVFYPVQYEGEESSLNVFYTGAAPNQQAIPAVDYFLEELGVESFALLGTDYVYPRTTNRILEQYLWTRASRRKTSSSTTRPSGSPTGRRSWPTWWRWANPASRSA
jgi:hypothetical protein